ncbi:putative membrane protein YgcG [Friedmanniella endophytica]|uniref:Putative membrane protein YgcG n=1 Tax=Microlunatus kandeliicorticis TaxID=1759536 RepID=A0A7W3P7K9_9ACTN|nr:DUF5130 family protein [Microlunatus kandeliicorticis]MBA8796095.1 putative membrane protein YgcG [Microlunatus kandeliicorticis]
MPVPAGERGLLPTPELAEVDQRRIDRARRLAEQRSGLTFAVHIGLADTTPRRTALRLLGELDDPERSVVVLCDPAQRALEIVTGEQSRRVLDDYACRLAAASMQGNLAAGDITGGLVAGLVQLGQAASRPRTLHLDRSTG